MPQAQGDPLSSTLYLPYRECANRSYAARHSPDQPREPDYQCTSGLQQESFVLEASSLCKTKIHSVSRPGIVPIGRTKLPAPTAIPKSTSPHRHPSSHTIRTPACTHPILQLSRNAAHEPSHDCGAERAFEIRANEQHSGPERRKTYRQVLHYITRGPVCNQNRGKLETSSGLKFESITPHQH
jgi:hypothetical protein